MVAFVLNLVGNFKETFEYKQGDIWSIYKEHLPCVSPLIFANPEVMCRFCLNFMFRLERVKQNMSILSKKQNLFTLFLH